MSWNKTKGFWLLFAVIIACVSCESAPQTLVVAGSGWNKVVKADKSGTILWSHDLENGQECNEITELDNGNILYAHRTGAKVITLSHKVVWQFEAEQGTELQSASLTKEGNYLLGQCGNPTKVIEFSPEGKKLKEICIETGISSPHSQLRRVRKTEIGTYLIPLLGKGMVCEYDGNGKLLKEIQVGGVPFSVVILKNKNWLVSCGDGHRLIEINPDTQQVVWELAESDVAGVPLRFVAEALRLENGNTIVCNWGGHSSDAEAVAQVFEIDSEKNLIWKIEDYQNFGNISTLDLVTNQKYYR